MRGGNSTARESIAGWKPWPQAAQDQGWDGFKNGKLLQAAEDHGFDVLLTGDQTLCYEQSLAGRRLAVVALSTVEWRIIKDHLQRISAAVDNAVPGTFQAVECRTFKRKMGSEA
jgi:hypothetical protein